VINHVVDSKIDSQMARTFNRPMPKGKVTPTRALIFAAVLTVVGYVVLELWVNRLTALLTLASLVGYAFIYTMYLKRATPQNIVIGGLAGAAPPLLGWVAVTNEVHAHALLLVLIIFIWTPPHFWALAIHRQKDYARAQVPMLPVTHGIEFTKTSILLYTLLLTVVCLLPYLIGMTGLIYLAGSTLLNGGFLYYAWKLKYASDEDTAMETFRFSIIHLMVLFVVLLVDHYARFTL
jgi:protoheme IX farnesyltransferase